MATTDIKTESARPSLSQNLETLYAAAHAGGAFDAKKDVVVNGSHNGMVSSHQSRTHTVKGFKTKMAEGQSELHMVNNVKTVTTTLRKSVYGAHSNKRYKP
jgi:hypothetical protein